MNLLKLTVYYTKDVNKYEASEIHTILGDMESIWRMWYNLHKKLEWPHVEVSDISGRSCKPENGLRGCSYSNY